MDHDRLHMRPAALGGIRARAVEEAQKAQRGVAERAVRAGEAAPPYVLVELIGKGGYGRVYKGEDSRTGEVVAVKIIDIDESDTANPRDADTYSEFLKEIAALKVLSEGRARNINHIIDALPVGQTMWMVTEYCGGGSVATLMRPRPGGLEEKWIIPILREVVEALGWVHRAGIIHRDVKCANILLTTLGAVQLCDFGIAATLSLPTSKRTTFIGTPHWMAPELFGSTRGYGVEVDIWAFGAVVVELATGLPPNASTRIPNGRLGAGFQTPVQRLEGEGLEGGVGSLAAFCMEEDPRKRPTIGEVQGHPYIHDTSLTHPTSTLVELIEEFRVWQDAGGSRTSLFMTGGAAGPSEEGGGQEDVEWDFESTIRGSTTQDTEFANENPQPAPRARGPRRRPPAGVLAPLRTPIERVFDPNTLSTYSLNSRAHYFPSTQTQPTSDSPLRNRDVVAGDETLKPTRDTVAADGVDDSKRRTQDWTFASSLPLPVDAPSTSDELDGDRNRRTRDWTFASSLPLPVGEVGDRGGGYGGTPPSRRQAADTDRMSMGEGLIDLDMSFSPSPYTPSPQQQDDTPSRASVAESLIDLDLSFSPSHPSPRSPQQQLQVPFRASVAESLIDLDMSVSPPSPPTPLTPLPPSAATPPAREQTLASPVLRVLPAPPSVEALSGVAGVGVVRSEMGRLLGELVEELGVVRDVLSGAGVV